MPVLYMPDGGVAEDAVFPAIDLAKSFTRNPGQLLDAKQVELVQQLRGQLSGANGAAGGLEQLIERMGASKSNDALLAAAAKEAS